MQSGHQRLYVAQTSDVYVFRNHMLAPAATKVQLCPQVNSSSILAVRDVASLGIIWYLSFSELKQETRVRIT